jgi:hypothetical protein
VRKMNERQRMIATVAVTALLAGGMIALVVMDRGEIQTQTEEIERLDERIRTADIEIRKTREREDQVIVYRDVENRELAVLPTKQKIADFHSNLSLFLSSAGVKFLDLPESSAIESDLAKGIYLTRTVVSCEADAASLLKLLNMLENDPRLVAVKGVRLNGGDRDMSTPDAPVLHEAELTLETYFYNPAEGGVRDLVPIPAAERRREDPAVQEAIASFQPERPDTYILRPAASRRDPFVDPRQIVAKEDPEAIARAFAEQEPVVIDLENKFRDASEKDEQAAASRDLGDVFRAAKFELEVDVLLNDLSARITQLDQAKSVTIVALSQRLAEVKVRVEGLRSRRPAHELIVTRALAEKTRDGARDAFERGDLTGVATLATQWETFLRGRQVEAEANPFIEDIRHYKTKAKMIVEFQGKGVRVTGTIVHESEPSRGMALVNGHVRRQGDAIDEK